MIDPKILVGYVESFTFINPEHQEALSGHPKVGRIYRIFETDGAYMLHIGAKNTAGKLEGIALGDSLSGTYDAKWTFSVIPINPNNYLDYPIIEEDLTLLLEWFENDHADLRRLMGFSIRPVDLDEVKPGLTNDEGVKFYNETGKEIAIPNDAEISRIKDIITKAVEGGHGARRRELVGLISDSLNYLMDIDPVLVEVLNDLFQHLSATYTEKYEDRDMPNISKDIQFSNILGKGANVYSAVKNIQAYSTSGYEGSDKPDSLLAAIHYCLFELQRRKING